jgi:hypothetical protein
MKQRKGFVANSSTASFVLVGFVADELAEREDIYEYLEDLNVDYLYGLEGGAPAGTKLVVGEFLLWISSDDYTAETESLDWHSVRNKVEELRNTLGLSTPIRIYSGMCAS